MADQKLIPLENHVIVQAHEEKSTTASGLIIQTSTKEKASKGVVIAVGPGLILDNGSRTPMDVSVGDVVHFTKYAPDEIELDGETYLVIKASSILAKEAK